MKTVNKLSKVVVALSFVFFGLVSKVSGQCESVGFFIKPETGEKIPIVSLTDTNETVVIRVMNSQGNMIYKEVYTQDRVLRKMYDYSILKPGEYSFNVKTRTEEYVCMVYLTDAYQLSELFSVEGTCKPMFYFENDQLLVSYINSDTHEMTMSIIDYSGGIVYEDNVGDGVVVNKKYDLEKLSNGYYQVNFISKGIEYSDYIVVR